MKEKIKYQNWPERVKITTALSNKNFLIKNHKIPLILGYIVLVIGILDFNYSDFSKSLKPLGFILIGIVNLVSANSLKWIANNSSWEERFENTSATLHKLIYLMVTIILLMFLYVIIMFD